jgi:hypothetical protein
MLLLLPATRPPELESKELCSTATAAAPPAAAYHTLVGIQDRQSCDAMLHQHLQRCNNRAQQHHNHMRTVISTKDKWEALSDA